MKCPRVFVYVTWENAFPPGRTVERGVPVLRFPVTRPRRMKVFADLSDEVFEGGASRERQEEWFRENGPETPELVEYLRAHGHEFDLVVFWTFRYYQSYFGLPVVADRAVLVPTAEDGYNLDLRNPHRADDLAHRSPEELVKELIAVEEQVLAALRDLQAELGSDA